MGLHRKDMMVETEGKVVLLFFVPIQRAKLLTSALDPGLHTHEDFQTLRLLSQRVHVGISYVLWPSRNYQIMACAYICARMVLGSFGCVIWRRPASLLGRPCFSKSKIKGLYAAIWEFPKSRRPSVYRKQQGSYYKDTHKKDPKFIEAAIVLLQQTSSRRPVAATGILRWASKPELKECRACVC